MCADSTFDVALFAYGTLQLPAVQLATFGRLLDGEPDTLPGFTLKPLAIDVPAVVDLSGLAVHQSASLSDDPNDRIPGIVFRISEAELAAADSYEVAAMMRVEAKLASGRTAFVYVLAAT
ncbi:MAG: gamma-glutamylcyclotransferase family protein [Sphingomicrobium sp.]